MESTILSTRIFVNSSYLQKSIGKPVALIGFVKKINSDSTSITIQTTDDQSVIVNFHEPIDSYVDGWLEIHGFFQDKGTVNGDAYFNLPSSITNDFDKYQFNETIKLMFNIPNPLK
ncbi:uncharacterized protein LOC126900287 isoform X2 [Daktulosphaira vitifoliae]|uniref:uncharacterized protein LOC126900287 isoform X2 n=1 Tax=Daktulosphaira vitifoliae TaxID=58002 RepID=UPI0021A9E19C|nr:uncharacterized protein LOC126900287 isoform X2 [Daktulosphaira vitifoliae]